MTINIPHLGLLEAKKPADEPSRLEDLRALRVLDTAAEKRFDRFTELVATTLDVPFAAVSFVDKERQWFKSCFGFTLRETPREFSFCQHAILEPEIMIVENTEADPRFSAHPMVVGKPGLRFYGGAVIRSESGRPLGTCCVLDTKPRSLTSKERSILLLIARMIETELGVARDMAVLRQRVRKLSLKSSETGLPNLELFRHRLDMEIARAKKNSRVLLLASIRIDRLDALEAALGHEAVTHIVSHLAGRIREGVEPPCFIAHTQEDKLALLTTVSPNRTPESIMEKLQACSARPVTLGDHAVPVGLSIGGSIYPTDADNVASLMKRARTALWSIPAGGKSRYRLYKRSLSDQASGEFRITAALQNALDNNEFHLVYQPKVDIRRHRLVSAEALVRWTSPVLGNVPPGTFIPVAERTGKIVELGNWVLFEACRQMGRWSGTSLPIPEISLNVTSHQLRQRDFVGLVERNLVESGLSGQQLNIEITESSLIDDLNGAVQIMKQLRALGVRISLDDFGTGFSSLSYLTRMPIQVLKIDRSFIRSAATHLENMKLVRSIVSMGHDLELDVVAEGVETEEQLEFLRTVGCDLVQGFFFSPPLSSERFERYARDAHENRRLVTCMPSPVGSAHAGRAISRA